MQKLKKYILSLLYLFIFLLPFQTRWIYHQGFLNGSKWEYGTFSLYATELLLGLIFILAIIYFFKSWKRQLAKFTPTKKSKFISLIILLGFLLIGLSALLAGNTSIAFYRLTHLVMAIALAFLMIVLKPAFEKISWAIISSSTLQALFAIQQFFSQRIPGNKWLGMAAQDPQTLGVPVVEALDTRVLRAFGTLPHPNILAGFLLVGLILIIGAYALAKQKDSSSSKLNIQKIIVLLFSINFFGLITTLSRAAILTFAIILIFLIIFSQKDKIVSRKISRFALIATVISIFFSVFFHSLIFQRATGSGRLESMSNATRIAQYKQSWSLLKNSWVAGVGLGNYTVALHKQNPFQPAWEYQPVHNTYLLIINELGLLGVLIVGIFIFYLIRIFKQLKQGNTSQLIGASCLFALALLAIFDHFLWSFFFGLIFIAIIITLPKLSTICHGEALEPFSS